MRVATCLSPRVRPVYERAARRIGDAAGVRADLVTTRSLRGLERGDHQVAFVCSPPALELADRSPPIAEIVAAPLLAGERYAGHPRYFSDVIVRAEDPAMRFAELEGRVWGYNEEDSHSGYGVLVASVAALGRGPDYFGSLVRTGSHARSISQVAAGALDAAAIDSQVLELTLRDEPALRTRLRVVEALGPSPIQPVVVRTDLGEPLRAAIVGTILALGGDPSDAAVLTEHGIQGFVPAGRDAYEPIRRMQAQAAAAGFRGARPR